MPPSSLPFGVTLLEQAEALAGRGRDAGAAPLFDQAQEIFERLEASPWLERVARERRAESISA